MAYGELLWLKDETVKTHANARADIARGLYGRSKYMWELVTGEVPDGQPCSPRNPQGLTGIDHSGAPWGLAWRHTCTVGEAYIPKATTNIVSPKKAITLSNSFPGILLKSSTVNGKPFHKNLNYEVTSNLGSPYELLELHVYGKLASAGSGTLACTLNTPNSNNPGPSGTTTVISTTLKPHVLNFNTGGSGFGCRMSSNGIKRVEFFLYWAGAQDFELHGWGFHQVRK